MPSGVVQPADERFWLFVDKNGRVNKDMSQCWSWLGGKVRGGYGCFKVNRRKFQAHRFSYALHHPLTNHIHDIKLFVCHKCDNPECSNPEHLFLGTVADNNRDKIEKERQAKGEKNHSKLTETQVREIREKYAKGDILQREIAQEYEIHPAYISPIILYKKWKHI